jgi:hypothetical protein
VPDGWEKRGLLLVAPVAPSWAHSHAALPCTSNRSDGAIDLYYSPRDAAGRAHVARARVEARVDTGELSVTEEQADPVLAPGRLGTFDESGTTVSCIVRNGAATHLYYTGWTRGVTVPFYFYAGLAIRAEDDGSFERHSEAPLLERNAVDPYLTASPWVLREADGRWRMWYVSCLDWRMRAGEPQHRYHIRYAESDDGVAWRRQGHVSIDFADDEEYALSRPCVVRDDDRYRMWFAARGERYLLGYAESDDGLLWSRADDRAGLEPSATGWDAEMVEYPDVLDHGGRRYLLYNGNGYGRSGIGYAISRNGLKGR